MELGGISPYWSDWGRPFSFLSITSFNPFLTGQRATFFVAPFSTRLATEYCIRTWLQQNLKKTAAKAQAPFPTPIFLVTQRDVRTYIDRPPSRLPVFMFLFEYTSFLSSWLHLHGPRSIWFPGVPPCSSHTSNLPEHAHSSPHPRGICYNLFHMFESIILSS